MKNLPAIILLFIANSVSGVAQGISMLAIPWYFARDGEMARFGLIYLLTHCVSLFWVPYAGVVIDRFDRKRIFLGISLIGGAILASIAGYGVIHGALPWWLVALVFALTFFNYNIHYPNLYAFVQEIAEPSTYGRITSALEVVGQLTTMLSGAGAALLLEGTRNGMLNVFGFLIRVPGEIEAWAIYEIFLLDASTYLVAFFIILLIRYKPLKIRTGEVGSLMTRLRTGYQFLKDHPYVFLFGVASYSIFVVIIVAGFFLDPMYVAGRLNETGDVYAASEMYYAFGAILAGFLILKVFSKWNAVVGVIVLTILTAAVTGWLAVANSVAIYYIVIGIMGVTNAGARILRVNYLFRNIPNQIYGRCNSIFNMINILMRMSFLGLFAIPFFHASDNVIYGFVILAVFLLVAASVMLFHYRKFVAHSET